MMMPSLPEITLYSIDYEREHYIMFHRKTVIGTNCFTLASTVYFYNTLRGMFHKKTLQINFFESIVTKCTPKYIDVGDGSSLLREGYLAVSHKIKKKNINLYS